MTATDTLTIEDRLDHLTRQVELLVADAARQRAERARWQELSQDLAPVARQAMDTATAELEELSGDVTSEDLVRFARTMARSLPTLERMLAQLESLSSLAAEATPLAKPGMEMLVERLGELEAKGYFGFARSGFGVMDRVVTSFTEEDVQALGDNVVTILQTVREMTQPEVMGMLRRTMHTVQEEESAEPPSLFHIAKEMRDPQVRMGLGRVIHMLRSVGETTPDTTTTTRR